MNLYTFRILTILLFIIVSCSTVEKTTQQPEEPEISEEGENAVPDWFDESAFGYVENNYIYSFGIASAASEKEALDLAIEQSEANMRTQIDYLLENARKELVENNESSVDTPGFIRTLRNSIQKIDLISAEIQTDTRETGNNVVVAYVQKILTKEQVKNIIRSGIQEENDLFLLLNTEVFDSI